ncbi:MAG: hypothetical protein LBL46_00835 [Rickettsiales bacterium]|jgi:hypothetical protein|nr:hypothetical protein [Rickettsiales bacterium]
MKKIKTFFLKVKHNMPAHMQWTLLGIAIVLCVMLILLLTGEKGAGVGEQASGGAAPAAEKKSDSKTLMLSIAPKEVKFGNVPAGETRTERVSVSANKPVIFSDVSLNATDSFLSMRQTCSTMGQVDKLPCDITLELKPDSEAADIQNQINLKYYDAAAGKDMEKLETISVSYSAVAGAAAPAPAPIPEPVAEPAPEPEPVADTIMDEPFEDDFFAEDLELPEVLPEEEAPLDLPEPVVEAPAPTKPRPAAPAAAPRADNYIPAKEECYQFAFAGYNNGGKQIGWIKPEGGRYMFHPFSDTECIAPTGEYNSKTGFIMSIDDPTKKLGSDADRIGGRGAGANLVMPVLTNPAPRRERIVATQINDGPTGALAGSAHVFTKPTAVSVQLPSSFNGGQAVVSSRPYDRTFVLRHFKPIPATIVNEIRAIDPRKASRIPVQATVDRHVYSDNGRTIVVPAGTLMLGNVTGDMPGPYKTIGRISIEWYRFIRPDGVEFNFTKGENERPFSGDAQGRVGVPGYGSSDYLEQMVMPLLTALVPAATNLISPVSDKIVNQIDLDNNTIVQSGTMRSSELAKQEMIKSWNKVTEKLFIDMMDNTKPPFTISAGTRITVYSPDDLIVAWCADGDDASCTPTAPATDYARAELPNYTIGQEDPVSMLGQVAAYGTTEGTQIKDERMKQLMDGFRQYQSIGMAKNDVYRQQLEGAGGIMTNNGTILQQGTDAYNQQYLGMTQTTTTDDNGNEVSFYNNPNAAPPAAPVEEMPQDVLLCETGDAPDNNGCCAGETFTDMGPDGWNCCPDAGGDCFPPIQ